MRNKLQICFREQIAAILLRFSFTWNAKERSISASRKRNFLTIAEIIFPLILGHSQQVVKRDIKSLSSYIIHPSALRFIMLFIFFLHYLTFFFIPVTVTCPQPKHAVWGQCTDTDTFSLTKDWINWDTFGCLLYFSVHFVSSSLLWC